MSHKSGINLGSSCFNRQRNRAGISNQPDQMINIQIAIIRWKEVRQKGATGNRTTLLLRNRYRDLEIDANTAVLELSVTGVCSF